MSDPSPPAPPPSIREGAFVLHLPSGTAGRVARIFVEGEYQRPAAGSPLSERAVELSTGDVFLLVSREQRAGEVPGTWLALPPELEDAAAFWLRRSAPLLAGIAEHAEQCGVPREWAHRLLLAAAREALPLKPRG